MGMENTAARNTVRSTLIALMTRFAQPLRYVASSLSSTGLDYALLLGLNTTVGGLLLPVVVARVSSCTMNYLLNRKVFAAQGKMLSTGLKYAVMASSVMMLSYLLIQTLVAAGLPLWLASLTANTSLFVVNYLGQTFFVFGSPADVVPAFAAVRSRLASFAQVVARRFHRPAPVVLAA